MTDAPSTYRVTGETGDWEVVLGLEVHAQVTSHSKLFSGASTTFGAEPNSQVSLVDAAMPGMLPVINGACVRQAVRTGMALGAKINRWSRFDRKNYFYADLPQGYQISQFLYPVVGEGEVFVDLEDGSTRTVGIERIHLEQDAGKSIHDQHPTRSYVDLNRSGVALMEIVSKPDMRSPEEAGAYVRKLRAILRYVGSCDGNMDEGSMRADVNVSVRMPGAELGTRCEIKNVNSVRFVMQAIEFEAKRQVEVIEAGGVIRQETRLFDPDKGVTRSMRSKEEAHDYRYFPDPDLLPLVLDDAFMAECAVSLPELPDDKIARYQSQFGLTGYQARTLTAERAWALHFERMVEWTAVETGKFPDDIAPIAANLVINEEFAFLKQAGFAEGIDPVTGEAVGVIAPWQGAKLIGMLLNGSLSRPLYKQLFEKIMGTNDDPSEVAIELGLVQVSDTGALDKAIAEVMAANPDKVAEYRSGKDKLFGFFVGQTMKATGGKANPAVINELLKVALAG